MFVYQCERMIKKQEGMMPFNFSKMQKGRILLQMLVDKKMWYVSLKGFSSGCFKLLCEIKE